MVHIEHTRIVCDHCDKLGNGVIISSHFNEEINSIQLCNEHSKWLSEELGK